MWMFAPLVASAALALGPHSPSAPPGGYALLQLTPAAACTETVPLLDAGATPVAPALRLFRLSGTAARRLAPALRARGALQTIEPDRPLRGASVTAAQPDPLEPSEWWRSAIGVDGLTPPGPGKAVTIVDSGVDLGHPEFDGRPDTVALNAQEPAPLGGQHGTAVASLVGAPENGVGIVGVYPQAVLRSWDTALGDGTAIDTSEVVKGITSAAAAGPGVINLSLGSPRKDDLVEQAVNFAFAKGSLVVVASGNDGDNGNPAEYPADYPHVLTVGASDRANQVAGFSSRSPYVDLVAPGQDVTVATATDSSWADESGTSFATPIVAGAAAWIWTLRPELDNPQLFEVVRRAARDVGAPGRDDASGYGLLDVGAALAHPAPIRDPLEPNDEIGGGGETGTLGAAANVLTTPRQPRASLRARLDRVEDPRDVYRIWLPAGRRVRVDAASTANVVVRVWGPRTTSVETLEDGDLLGKDARPQPGRKRVAVAPARPGRWAYVEVTLGGRRGLQATYSLSVA
jgi:hypothetical protein